MEDVTKNELDKPETIVEQEQQKAESDPQDLALVSEVKEKPYHPIFPGMDVEKPEAYQFKLGTWWLLGVLIVIFFVLKKFIYIPDGDRDGK